ncbi:MAG: hypothetical protein COA91_09275 [Robiginitomaculum sp.]|nr:MAG: hypothetical protein COA91_09275 [Robiginitomaculum sp.]
MKTITNLLLASALATSCFSAALAGPYEDGIAAFNNLQDGKAFQILKPVADSGHAKAQNMVGFMYVMGMGVDGSQELATQYYRKAAEQGYMEAQANLARQYRLGRGVPKSNATAAYWYKKSADQGNAESAKLLKEINDEIHAAQKPLGFSIYDRIPAPATPSVLAKPATPSKPSPPKNPFMLTWKPNQGFPVFANTDLSDIGDAAASCFVVTINILEAEVEKAKSSAEYRRTKFAPQLLNIKLDSYERYYMKPVHNGGLSKQDAENAFLRHHDSAIIAKALKFTRGPTEEFCRDNFNSFLVDSVTAIALSKTNKH